MKVDLVVINGKLVLPEIGPTAGSLVVKGGQIVRIAVPGQEPPADEILDAGGRVVLPGLVDPHVHYGWLLPLEDRIRAESAFGVSGGITTIMRYFRRPESYLTLFGEQIQMSNRVHYQDYAIHLTLFTENQVAELRQYVERLGVTSFKIYTNMRGQFGRDVALDLRPDSNSIETYNVDFSIGHLYEVFLAASRVPARIRISVHCEDGEVVCRGIDRARELGLGGLPAWHYACPDIAEALAISQVSVLSRANNVPVYFPHIGSRASIKAVNEARASGTDLVAETCPHYLTQTTDCPAGVLAKIKPPIRTIDDQRAVWQAVHSGLIETIGSDHVGYMLREKNAEDIWQAHTAFPGTGLILPLLLSEGVNRNQISLQQLSRITSYNAARAFGLYPQKGTMLPGADADFVIVDLNQRWQVRANELLSASDFSIYEGMELTGAVNIVYVRGIKVFENGKVVGKVGHGKYINQVPVA